MTLTLPLARIVPEKLSVYAIRMTTSRICCNYKEKAKNMGSPICNDAY